MQMKEQIQQVMITKTTKLNPEELSSSGMQPERPTQVSQRHEDYLVMSQISRNSFEEEPLPNFDQRQALAKMLGMTPRSVQIWFQNRRQRLKPMQSKSSSPGLSHGGMQQRFGSKHGQTPQQQLGMPGLAAAAGLCSGTGTGGGTVAERCDVSQLPCQPLMS